MTTEVADGVAASRDYCTGVSNRIEDGRCTADRKDMVFCSAVELDASSVRHPAGASSASWSPRITKVADEIQNSSFLGGVVSKFEDSSKISAANGVKRSENRP